MVEAQMKWDKVLKMTTKKVWNNTAIERPQNQINRVAEIANKVRRI
jgi:hypothetical protein